MYGDTVRHVTAFAYIYIRLVRSSFIGAVLCYYSGSEWHIVAHSGAVTWLLRCVYTVHRIYSACATLVQFVDKL